MTFTDVLPVDPLVASSPGRYRDQLVEVTRGGVPPQRSFRTRSFAFWADESRVHLMHDLPAAQVDNDLAGLLAAELFAPGWVTGSELFERLMTGLVVSSGADPASAWELFYRNTLSRLTGLAPLPKPHSSAAVEGSIDGYAPVYCHATTLIGPGTVLELGSCFGFFSLLLSSSRLVTASDVVGNTMRLLRLVSARLGGQLDTLVCDAARVPRPDASFDTVVALHLLEHLPVDHGAAVVAEAQRLARKRVVIAVPFEDRPTAAYGHVRTFDAHSLAELGADSGWRWRSYEHHGGWLILDRPSA